jgi:predicted RecB family nuclease
MKKDDLTNVKHVGALRMKKLNDAGIKTIKQLSEIPLEKLMRINTIGERYAKLIRAAAAESIGKKPVVSKPKAASAKKKKPAAVDPILKNRIAVLRKRLKQANEKLKPLDKKKYLELYIDFKKKSKRLKSHLNNLTTHAGKLSKKETKDIIKNANALSLTLKNVGKKPKKKKYQKVSQELQSFSRMLKKQAFE